MIVAVVAIVVVLVLCILAVFTTLGTTSSRSETNCKDFAKMRADELKNKEVSRVYIMLTGTQCSVDGSTAYGCYVHRWSQSNYELRGCPQGEVCCYDSYISDMGHCSNYCLATGGGEPITSPLYP